MQNVDKEAQIQAIEDMAALEDVQDQIDAVKADMQDRLDGIRAAVEGVIQGLMDGGEKKSR